MKQVSADFKEQILKIKFFNINTIKIEIKNKKAKFHNNSLVKEKRHKEC